MPTLNEINFKVNMTYGDTSLSDQSSEEQKLIMFIIWGIILPLIVMAGMVGNILTMIVLWRREMHSTTILYLRGMVITDTGILIGSIITMSPISCANYLHSDALHYFRDAVYPVLYTPAYYIMMILQQCNVWITVSVSMERYIAICHPFRAARLVTRRKTIIVLISIVVLSIIYNIPHLFATTANPCGEPHPPVQPRESSLTVVAANGGHISNPNASVAATRLLIPSTTTQEITPQLTPPTTTQQETPQLTPATTTPPSSSQHIQCMELATTEFGNAQFYTIYRTIIYSILIYVIPFLALLVLNIFLIKELMIMQKRRSGTNIHEENEANLSLVLVLIVIVFIFCQTPSLVSQFDLIRVDIFFYWLTFSNILFTTNSAVNFLIYTAFGRKFRRVLLRVFRHLFKKNRRQSQSSFRMTQFTDADFDTCDPTEPHSSPLCGVSCYKTEVKSIDEPNECVPLNTPTHTSSTANGVTRSTNCQNGTERVVSSRNDIDSEVDTVGCETMDASSAILPEDKPNSASCSHDNR